MIKLLKQRKIAENSNLPGNRSKRASNPGLSQEKDDLETTVFLREEISQLIFAALIELNSYKATHPDLGNGLADMEFALRKSIDKLQKFNREKYPFSLHHFGLVEALADLLDDYHLEHQDDLKKILSGVLQREEHQKSAFFHLVRETLDALSKLGSPERSEFSRKEKEIQWKVCTRMTDSEKVIPYLHLILERACYLAGFFNGEIFYHAEPEKGLCLVFSFSLAEN
ncbi:MAG: hypothetical protein H6581_02440 [Bacteroidia bacterium]|nr:hypothetical protein [Bacteroidia bacterium]